jgi:hypothetical protein
MTTAAGQEDEVRKTTAIYYGGLVGGLMPACPYIDLDGRYHPGCEHQTHPVDPAAVAVLEGVARGILNAGVPRPAARAGDFVRTTWGCERNRRLKERDALISCVTLVLGSPRGSPDYVPMLEYIGKTPGKETGRDHYGMCLLDFTRADGATWTRPARNREGVSPFAFRLEWVSPWTGAIQRAFKGPYREEAAGHAG